MVKTSPKTLAELENAIAAQHMSLSKRLGQIAKYIVESPDKIAFGTVAVIAKDASVHPSTLVRFANAFGFSGFTEMQLLFRQQLIQESPNYNDRFHAAREALSEDADSPKGLLNQFVSANAASIELLNSDIQESSLNNAVTLLANAQIIYIVGVRRAFTVANYFSYMLRHIKRKAFLIDGTGGAYKEQSGSITKADVLLAISFHPYGDETKEVVEAANKLSVPIILLTDSELCPLAASASVCLKVCEAEVLGFRSLTSSLCLAQSLSIALASALDKQAR